VGKSWWRGAALLQPFTTEEGEAAFRRGDLIDVDATAYNSHHVPCHNHPTALGSGNFVTNRSLSEKIKQPALRDILMAFRLRWPV